MPTASLEVVVGSCHHPIDVSDTVSEALEPGAPAESARADLAPVRTVARYSTPFSFSVQQRGPWLIVYDHRDHL